MRRKRSLLVPLAVALLAAGVSASSERAVVQEYGPWDFVGFSPKLCVGDLPPAELLALADWPLDADGGGCRMAPAPVARPVVTTASAVPEPHVVEVSLLPTLDPLQDREVHAPERQMRVEARFADDERFEPEQGDAFSGRLVADAQLGEMRGGFETPSGLAVSFGIERVVHINGELVSSTVLTVADLRGLAGSGVPVALPVGTAVGVIQNGPNNGFDAGSVAAGALATVIQNSLDNQHIQTTTTINAQVNSVGLLQASRFSESLRSAVNASVLR